MPSYSISPSSPFLSLNNRCNFRRSDASFIDFATSFSKSHTNSRRREVVFFASVAERKIEASWIPSDENDDYGGWSIAELQIEKNKKAMPKFLIAGVGTSMAMVLAVIAHCSFSGKGFSYRMPLHALQSLFMPSHSKDDPRSTVASDAYKTKPEDKSAMGPVASGAVDEDRVLGEKLERVIIPVATDSTQQEALLVLKKLKIIEEDVKLDELCARREYARWLLKANSFLERTPKHRIASSMLIAGSTVTAFDDVSVSDPDFWCIQSLAEAGIVPSKLSTKNSSFLDVASSESQGRVEFSPESSINRLDLLNWKAQLEYSLLPGIEEKMSRKKVGFMDVTEVTPDASPELFMDLLAGDRSIFRRVFGYSRRFQPLKPATKAQAAVALTSGRMAEAICAELSRLEAENSLNQAEMEEIRSELLLRGEIPRFWEGKINEEKSRGVEVERDFLAAMHDLEKEKLVRDENQSDFLKEKAALDCQWQLLLSLKEEVDEMRERLTAERASFADEQRSLEELFVDLQGKREATAERKSILEAEIEALRILKSWVEDEARQTQIRAKVLEQAGRRWKWDDS